MTTPQWLSRRMLEFNFLPSYTLHPSRFDTYAVPGLARAIQDKPGWHAAWHRHWSRGILKTLNVGVVAPASHRELALALLRDDAVNQLARRVGLALCGASLRHMIAGESVRALHRMLGPELLTFARRDSVRYVQHLPTPSLTALPETLEGIETLGYGAVLASVSQATPELVRRVELKLPQAIHESDSPLSAVQAWALCVAVLKDMDPTWCSSFPEIH